MDVFLARHGLKFESRRFGGAFKIALIDGRRTAFLKPETYMNLSGGPLLEAMKDLDVDINDILVIHDDLDIGLGEARFKDGGGHAGHNGLKSIIEATGTNGFKRIRLGIGRPERGEDISEYVLSDFNEREEDSFFEGLEKAFELLETKFLGESGAL